MWLSSIFYSANILKDMATYLTVYSLCSTWNCKLNRWLEISKTTTTSIKLPTPCKYWKTFKTFLDLVMDLLVANWICFLLFFQNKNENSQCQSFTQAILCIEFNIVTLLMCAHQKIYIYMWQKFLKLNPTLSDA